MNFSNKTVVLAMLVATTQGVAVSYVQAANTPLTPATQSTTKAEKTPVPLKTPDDWIVYEDSTYTPVVDDVSRHLDAARKAFNEKDSKKAASEMRAVADALKQQAARADTGNNNLIKEDKALLAADSKFALETTTRMNASAQKVISAANAIEAGKIKNNAELDKVIDRATRADMERRWRVSDVETWYPLSEEPQQHFMNAVAAYASNRYSDASTNIRKAISYLRLEANRAMGNAKEELDDSIAQLGNIANSIDERTLREERTMTMAFAKANHALALAHRVNAAESWARQDVEKAGYELKAAAHALKSGAGWAGGEIEAGATATAANTRLMGDKITAGAAWTRNEIAKTLESLGDSINTLGKRIGGTKKA